jgi:hypothetical protein
VPPLDLLCLASRAARLGPVGAAYTRSGIVAATDGSLKKSGAMGAAYVVKDNCLPSRSVAVFGLPSSIRPELKGIASGGGKRQEARWRGSPGLNPPLGTQGLDGCLVVDGKRVRWSGR